jgi:hypothetical protein
MRIRCYFPRGYGEYRLELSLDPLEKLTLELALPVDLLFSTITEDNAPELADNNLFLCQWLESMEGDDESFRRKRESLIALLWEDCEAVIKLLADWPVRYLK